MDSNFYSFFYSLKDQIEANQTSFHARQYNLRVKYLEEEILPYIIDNIKLEPLVECELVMMHGIKVASWKLWNMTPDSTLNIILDGRLIEVEDGELVRFLRLDCIDSVDDCYDFDFDYIALSRLYRSVIDNLWRFGIAKDLKWVEEYSID